jgi:rubrerythrin
VGLEAEQRARDFYEQVFATATDLDVKLLAAALAQEEAQHVEWLERALATAPGPHIDWERF